MRYALAFALVFVGTTFSACGEDPAPPPVPRPVRAIKAGDLTVFEGRSFPGKAAPAEEVLLSFRVGGPLVERPADVGSVVEAGQLLARIDPRDFEVALASAQGLLDETKADLVELLAGARQETIRALESKVRAAKASYELAKTEEGRYRKLLNDAVVSQSEYDKHKLLMDVSKEEFDAASEDLAQAQVARPEVIQAKQAQIRSREAAVAHAADELADTELKAPFAGEISAMLVENFQTVQARQSICRLLDTTHVEFTIQLPEVLISSMDQIGDLKVAYDALPGLSVPATVKHVRSEATSRTRTYPVTLLMAQPTNARILPGMAGSATGRRVKEAVGDGLEIPLSAVITDAQDRQLVWVIDEGTKRVRTQVVETLRMTSTGIRVTGIEPGTWIAVAGVNSLGEGQEVRILDAAEEGNRP